MMEQMAKKPNDDPPEVSKKTSPGKRGRPQGSKNRNRRAVELSPALRFVQETITRFLQLIGEHVKVMYFVCKRSQGVERGTMFNRARRDQVDVRRTNW
jgi:hypothetical protein